MTEPIPALLNPTRLLVDLQHVNAIAATLAGCLDPEQIAQHVTDGLVTAFDCAFARLWIVETDQRMLRLLASAGLYTHTNGSFARVPMGAFKVGKIAQNRIPFLSNNLPNEPWVKDREWAISHQIQGFAGYPLAIGEEVIGVLAVFSHRPLSAEFLEVLQGLCTTVTVALMNARQHQLAVMTLSPQRTLVQPLSDRLATIFQRCRLILVGTERPLSPSLESVVLNAAETLDAMACSYCRLTYETTRLVLDAMLDLAQVAPETPPDWLAAALAELTGAVTCLGGTLQTHTGPHQTVIQVLLQLPYRMGKLGPALRVQCQSPMLQLAFTQLAYQAGLTVTHWPESHIPLLTDNAADTEGCDRILWVNIANSPAVSKTMAKVMVTLDLSFEPAQRLHAVEAAYRNEVWQSGAISHAPPSPLSEREHEILVLLAQGLRDRDIATTLVISERTVKFHINNILSKLEARTRSQALYQAIVQNWLAVRPFPETIAPTATTETTESA